MSKYIKFDCPECGMPLEVWSEETLELRKEIGNCFPYECRAIIRHCEYCGRDWENEWKTENGDVVESPLKRKYWG